MAKWYFLVPESKDLLQMGVVLGGSYGEGNMEREVMGNMGASSLSKTLL